MSNEKTMNTQFKEKTTQELVELYNHLMFETKKPVPLALIMELDSRGALGNTDISEEDYQLKANKIK